MQATITRSKPRPVTLAGWIILGLVALPVTPVLAALGLWWGLW